MTAQPTCHPETPSTGRYATDPKLVDLTVEHDDFPDTEIVWCTVCGSLWYAESIHDDATWHAPKPASIYQRLKAAGCKIDHHESDLYVEATETAQKLTEGQPNRSFFVSQVDGKHWIELPFMYEPFWLANGGTPR